MTNLPVPPPPPLDDDSDTIVSKSYSAGKQTPEQQGANIPKGWVATVAEPIPVVRCTGFRNDGERCNRWSYRGTTVCLWHGAQLPNVRKAADERVMAAKLRFVDNVEDAMDTLFALLQPGTGEGIRLKAATEILDRAGLKAGTEIAVTVEHVGSPLADIMNQLDIIAGNKEPEVVLEEFEDAEVIEEA